MTHIAIQEALNCKVVDWMEKVSDIAAARRKFTPEFINRLDNLIVFKSSVIRNCAE